MAKQGQSTQMQASVDYWWSRVAASFGTGSDEKIETLRKMGLRQLTGAEMKDQWEAIATEQVEKLGLKTP